MMDNFREESVSSRKSGFDSLLYAFSNVVWVLLGIYAFMEIQNVINLYLAFPVSGVGGDFSSNIGTVSATVKDILGN